MINKWLNFMFFESTQSIVKVELLFNIIYNPSNKVYHWGLKDQFECLLNTDNFVLFFQGSRYSFLFFWMTLNLIDNINKRFKKIVFIRNKLQNSYCSRRETKKFEAADWFSATLNCNIFLIIFHNFPTTNSFTYKKVVSFSQLPSLVESNFWSDEYWCRYPTYVAGAVHDLGVYNY